MRALKLFAQKEGSLLADYGSRMGEALVRRRAEMEVRAARAEAEVAIKARSEFLANMNHELRTPLNAIIGFATMLRDGDELAISEDQRRTYAEYILQSADLLLGHINTILEVSALDGGSVEYQHEEVDLSELLDYAVERARVRAAAAKVQLERRDEGDAILGWGDHERIGQAADHLIQMAIDSCNEGGKVLVRACIDEDGWGEIAVRDNGEGYTPEELNDALEAFKETHRGLDRSFAGAGVGYAVAKTFIDMQGGRFELKSRKGQGTLARIALPPPAEMRSTGDRTAPADTPDASDPSMVERKDDAA